MQIAMVVTYGPTVRSEIVRYEAEDTALLIARQLPLSSPYRDRQMYIGDTPKMILEHGTVLEMITVGWVLAGPPHHNATYTECTWWLTRKTASDK